MGLPEQNLKLEMTCNQGRHPEVGKSGCLRRGDAHVSVLVGGHAKDLGLAVVNGITPSLQGWGEACSWQTTFKCGEQSLGPPPRYVL